jgi:CRISPR-associated endonuclease/helicase Cas3
VRNLDALRLIEQSDQQARKRIMTSQFFAHSLPGPIETWEPLDDHLRAVAHCAREFARAFEAGDWGFLAGLWHDLGKYLPEFQRRLHGDSTSVDHAGPGAAAARSTGDIGLPLAFAIVGHHSGLPNLAAQAETSLTPLLERIKKQRPAWDRIEKSIPAEFWPLAAPQLPISSPSSEADRDSCRRQLELWIRFLFSALVDADYLETERFYDSARGERRRRCDSLEVLRERLNGHLAGFSGDTPVNRARADILTDCPVPPNKLRAFSVSRRQPAAAKRFPAWPLRSVKSVDRCPALCTICLLAKYFPDFSVGGLQFVGTFVQ